jgi:glycosyltransferase involved in cell wall biosynthesis
MIYVFYNNDPLAQDQGGGAEHFRSLHRALRGSGLPYRLVASRLQAREAPEVVYISAGANFLRFYLALWLWFWQRRHSFGSGDVFHFHRNYAAWPKLLLCPGIGRVLISYHNVTGRVLEGRLGRLAAPIRAVMLRLERRAVQLADAIVCVNRQDRDALAQTVVSGPFEHAHVIPAAFDSELFTRAEASPPPPGLATRLLFLGRISHQKNVPLAIETLERLVADGGDYSLTIAGAGEDSKDLIRRIARSPAGGRITWLGGVAHDAVPGLMAEHGILLLTSRYEASPTVVKEALRSMRPVVATDVGDVADWLDRGRTGWVCRMEAGDLADACRAATRLVLEGRYGAAMPGDGLDERAIMNQVLRLYRWLAAV